MNDNANNSNITRHTASTKPDENSAAKQETAIAINWENISLEDTRKLASRTIIIAAQGQWRRDGGAPAEATLDANDYANPDRTRKPRDPMTAAKAALAKLSPEELAELLANR